MKWQIIAVLFVAGALQGCATDSLEKRVNEKVGRETAINTRADASQEAKRVIQTAPELSEEQRAQLMTLRKSAHAEMEDISKESLRLRTVLVKDLIAHYNEEEIRVIKDKIRKLEDQKVSLIFSSVDQANQIMGRQAGNNIPVLNELFEGPRGHHN